jgi:hypothetical protein
VSDILYVGMLGQACMEQCGLSIPRVTIIIIDH